MLKRKLLLGLIIILGIQTISFGVEIVYPRKQNSTINSATTFFIGKQNPNTNLTINSQTVTVHQSGGFNHPVNLDYGENIFNIFDGKKNIIYKITRQNNNKLPAKHPITTYYDEPKFMIVKEDNCPLRSTPIDFGTNRLQHLEQDIPLKVIGEQNNFYKVQLARDDYAYILKEDVIQTNIPTEQANIENYVYEETDKTRYFKIKLSNKTPYILSENDGLDLVIYNVKGFPENKYEFHINKIGKIFGYRSYYKNNSELIIEVKKYPIINPQTPLSGLIIAIDAGHGGNEIGTIGCLGHKEKDVNLQVANILQDKLVTKGAKVQNLRVDDYDLSLTDRVEMAQYLNPDIFVSIHHNAPPDSAAFKHKSGSSVFYFYHQAKPLAKAIQKRLTQDLGMKDDTVKSQSFAVVRNTNSIAVLVEIGYMTDPEDNSKIIDQKFQEKAADAIIHGLEDYLNGIQ